MKRLRWSLTLTMVSAVVIAHFTTKFVVDYFLINVNTAFFIEALILPCVTFLMIHSSMRSLRSMVHISHAIAEKDFTQRLSVKRLDEIGEMATALNQVAENLQVSFEDLELKNEYIGDLNRNFEVVTQELETANHALKEAQAQLLQREKMASVGQLAAGVAHEINNPIGFINSNLGTLQGYVDDLGRLVRNYDALEQEVLKGSEANVSDLLMDIAKLKKEIDVAFLIPDMQQLVQESRDGADRVKKIVQDLKEFSHVDQSAWTMTNLHSGLESTLNIARSELKYRIEVVKEYGDIPDIHCYPQELNQVFMNLVINAAHAISDKGEIRIKTSLQGDDVVIAIRDTGQGIPQEDLKKIFDPFFTTKPVGKGTGLGLSIVYGIIKRHNGRIEVDSVLGEGTTFRICLPVDQEGPASEDEKLSKAAPSSQMEPNSAG